MSARHLALQPWRERFPRASMKTTRVCFPFQGASTSDCLRARAFTPPCPTLCIQTGSQGLYPSWSMDVNRRSSYCSSMFAASASRLGLPARADPRMRATCSPPWEFPANARRGRSASRSTIACESRILTPSPMRSSTLREVPAHEGLRTRALALRIVPKRRC